MWRSGATGCFICGTGFAAEPSDRQLILALLSLEGDKSEIMTRRGRSTADHQPPYQPSSCKRPSSMPK